MNWNKFVDISLMKLAKSDIVENIVYLMKKSSIILNKETPLTIYLNEEENLWTASFSSISEKFRGHVDVEFYPDRAELCSFYSWNGQLINFKNGELYSKNNFISALAVVNLLDQLSPMLKIPPEEICIDNDIDFPISSIEWNLFEGSVVIGYYIEQNLFCYSILSKGNYSDHGNINENNLGEVAKKINFIFGFK